MWFSSSSEVDPYSPGPFFRAKYHGECSRTYHPFEAGDEIRADGYGCYECRECVEESW